MIRVVSNFFIRQSLYYGMSSLTTDKDGYRTANAIKAVTKKVVESVVCASRVLPPTIQIDQPSDYKLAGQFW